MKPDGIYSVVFPIKEDEQGNIVAINLATKTRKMFVGKILGGGGRQDLADADIFECGCREFREELTRRYEASDLEEVGVILSYEGNNGNQKAFRIHYFLARGGKGPIRASKKDNGMVNPTWYAPKDLPYEKMPVHIPMLLDKFLKGFRVTGTIRMDSKKNVLFEARLKPAKKIEAPA